MDVLFAKESPHSIEAEQAVLGALLIDSRCLPDVISVLKPSDFYSETNRGIFEVICSMFNTAKSVDAVTLIDELKQCGKFDAQTTQTYIVELMQITPTTTNLMQYVEIVRDKSVLRNISEIITETKTSIYDGSSSDTVLEEVEKKIYALRQGSSVDGLESIKDGLLTEAYNELTYRYKNAGILPGLSTGFPELDNTIMGLKKTDLIILASRPGMGKTAFALNMALHISKKSDKAIAIFSLEMSKQQLIMRLLSGEAFVDSKKLQTGMLDKTDWQKLSAATATLSNTNIYINDNSAIGVSDINAQCRRIPNLGLVIIDYLQLMTSGKTENRVQAVAEISRMLKIAAKELNVPVLAMSQLSRANTQRQGKRPMLSDLRESGSLEQDADIVLGLYRDDYFNKSEENEGKAELIVMKNRHGETKTIDLQWIPQYTTYTAIERNMN